MIETAFARQEEPVAHHRLLHFDTETTGVAGGTDTRAWIIDAADWLDDGRFRLRQPTIMHMGGAHRVPLRRFRGEATVFFTTISTTSLVRIGMRRVAAPVGPMVS